MNNNENTKAQLLEIELEHIPITNIHPPINKDVYSRSVKTKLALGLGLVITICVLILVTRVIGQRYVPISELGQVNGTITVAITQVSGEVSQVLTQLHGYVAKGDVIAQIDPKKYQDALKNAEIAVTSAGKNIGQLSKNVRVANIELNQAQANFEVAKAEQNSALDKVTNGELTQASAQTAKANFNIAETTLSDAQTALLTAKDKFAAEAGGDTNVKSALLDLEHAQLNIQRANIIAAKDGVITQVNIAVGDNIATQTPIVSYLAADDIWIDVLFSENQLGNINKGNRVEFSLAFAPGQVFSGNVAAIDFSANTNASLTSNNQHRDLNKLRYFPVKVNVAKTIAQDMLNVGGQADVIVYTSDNSLFNRLGHWWFKLTSLVSYLN